VPSHDPPATPPPAGVVEVGFGVGFGVGCGGCGVMGLGVACAGLGVGFGVAFGVDCAGLGVGPDPVRGRGVSVGTGLVGRIRTPPGLVPIALPTACFLATVNRSVEPRHPVKTKLSILRVAHRSKLRRIDINTFTYII
jgi:hypothetical protein